MVKPYSRKGLTDVVPFVSLFLRKYTSDSILIHLSVLLPGVTWFQKKRHKRHKQKSQLFRLFPILARIRSSQGPSPFPSPARITRRGGESDISPAAVNRRREFPGPHLSGPPLHPPLYLPPIAWGRWPEKAALRAAPGPRREERSPPALPTRRREGTDRPAVTSRGRPGGDPPRLRRRRAGGEPAEARRAGRQAHTEQPKGEPEDRVPEPSEPPGGRSEASGGPGRRRSDGRAQAATAQAKRAGTGTGHARW